MEITKIAIVDDQSVYRNWLSLKIEAYMKDYQLGYRIFSFESGESFVSALAAERFDIVFMDIHLKGITGVEAAKELRKKDMDCKLVFLAATKDFMSQVFALNSCHYLIKPISDEDFIQAMENCRIRKQYEVPFLDITSGGQLLHLNTTRILYVDIVNRNTIIHMTDHTISAGRNFNAIAKILLEDQRFLLCIKGVLVNMDAILKQEENSFLLKNGEHLPIAMRGKKEVFAQFRRYLFEKN